MKKSGRYLVVLMTLSILFSCQRVRLNQNDDFGAYYTKILSDEVFEKYSRTGDYSDLIVDLGSENGKVVFWRGSGYLPYWEPASGERIYFEEILPRSGDGINPMMPDRVNTYSYAKIIESSANQAIIHWRYLQSFAAGNAHKEVYPDGFVDEYFTFLPDGEVRRSIRKGRKMTDEWNNPANMMSQTILLSLKGLVSSEVTAVGLEMDIKKVEGADIFEPENLNPEAILSYTFDEGLGGEVNESYSKYRSSVTGRKTLWRTGVSGTCLQFDGYYTEVRMPVDKALPINDEISLQAFIAIGAYPWSWCPIVQQADDVPENVITGRRDGNYFVEMEKEDDTGFFLGIDGDGHPGFKLRVGGVWEELYGDFHLERRQWYLLTATYSRQKHEMKIYVDEQLVGKMELQDGVVELSEKDILIGRGKERRPINPVRRNTFPGQYAFDGLIDEVKIFNHSLTDKMISEQYRLANLADAEIEMDKRIMPSGRAESGFGASYEHLKFYDIWDNLWCFSDHPDVVVGFEDNPSKFVFWRGVSYIPMMVNEKGQWYSNEFNETWGTSGGDGCQEPMSDKGNYFTYARILENTPARVVVHYRFPLADVNLVKANYVEETGWYDVADWYYYIYPDGIATKRKHLWTSGSRNHEWQESMAIFGPDQHPEDIIEKENTVHMQDMDGQSAYYNWTTAPPPNVDEPEEQCIQTVNYTGKYDPITIGEAFESSNVYGGELTPFSVFPTWNHWPVAQMASDGRYASYADRTGHSSLTHVYLPVYAEAEGDKPFYEKLLMEGMLNTDEVDLVNLARSWNHAPAIDLEGEGKAWYEKPQRAYFIEGAESAINFIIKANDDQPVHNLALVIKNWGNKKASTIHLDGKIIEAKQGISRDTDGSYTLHIWIKTSKTNKFKINITK
ncbi:MAG: LamG domain-containing protein [Bacteroidetes bacterium]|jgi:hypothetical protein|nr:LamG domain-containing protein [Bacteroidota bacterium]MBT3749944.1 LamG domain-containing protein [Bacteroidota bacterium]MBT4408386.1 LamG domain-containing protein [Bacteroidota bacterium]MBT7464059.1 LamG domain-containing protein [Bacteroidota bacterium]